MNSLLLYELTSPTEQKYCGNLTKEQITRCTKETLLSPRWALYPFKSPIVENLCGKFVVDLNGQYVSVLGLCGFISLHSPDADYLLC